ncbi:phosphatase PAP2 family protein [Roseateles sp. DAIF2]|uniref:phosphatase PAP2 family protein n=1 Tax=Roseateles sp. DAIF2 TaxID=2714952 RepID=UPI0018A2FCA3|nr:phosphatase PAP2 family protein [Roseateles sp. DAIF2]QPF71822.1 phosphatase PAP2 family protein [Roseateles sp. DAIF2]
MSKKIASDARLALATGAALLLLLAWEGSGLDLRLAALAGGPAGFALREHWLLVDVLHQGGRLLAWLLMLLVSLGLWWPQGPLRRLAWSQRLQLVLSGWLAVLVVSLLKGASSTSCPWDLQQFGGVARYVPHWLGFWRGDGGGGHCFPAGHASAGFAFVGGYFAFRGVAPAIARRWLCAALAAGLLLGLSQQLRGAHFMSHTLWSALLCWLSAWALDGMWRLRRRPLAGQS